MEHIYQQPQFGEDWFDYSDLYRSFVDRMSDGGVFVEVGSWKGKSISYIAVEIINSGKKVDCYAVDTWKGSEEHSDDPLVKNDLLYDIFLSNIKPITQSIIPIRKPSLEAANDFKDESIDIVYIDASHKYEDVKADIIAWLPKVKKGGIISGHDYQESWFGVIRAVNEVFGADRIKRSCVSSWSVEL